MFCNQRNVFCNGRDAFFRIRETFMKMQEDCERSKQAFFILLFTHLKNSAAFYLFFRNKMRLSIALINLYIPIAAKEKTKKIKCSQGRTMEFLSIFVFRSVKQKLNGFSHRKRSFKSNKH
jgi:hypothetical protein